MDANPTPTVVALIVAAGRGIRAGGGLPKQFRDLAGEPVLSHTLRAFDDHPAIGHLVVVHHPDDTARLAPLTAYLATPCKAVTGGATRDASVRAGLAACDGDLVLIHDAARPLVSRAVIDGVLDALATHDGAAPALAVTDALWRGDATVSGTADRAGLWRAQTPQGFRLGPIRAAHDARPEGAADDVEVAAAAGMQVAITQGDEANLKLTQAEDFARAEALLAARKGPQMIDVRTGNGFDVHRFGPGDHVMLCGVAVPHGRALEGHSDADVGLHALTDAIYGAMGMGDIGTHFPPSDPQWQGAESLVFLTDAVEMAAREGFVITHADVTLICEYPKIGPHADAMRTRLAELLRIEAGRVSVKATTTERLGFPGREEGIAALSTATLVRP